MPFLGILECDSLVLISRFLQSDAGSQHSDLQSTSDLFLVPDSVIAGW